MADERDSTGNAGANATPLSRAAAKIAAATFAREGLGHVTPNTLLAGAENARIL